MGRSALLEVTSKPIAPEVLAAYKNGQLDLRALPKGSGTYLLQAWAVAVYGPGKAAEHAFGTALRKVGLILGQRTQRPQPDPGGARMHPGTTGGGPATWMNYVDTPEVKLGAAAVMSRAREASALVVEELGKAGFHPVQGRVGAGLIALTNILNMVCQQALNRPQGSNEPKQVAAEGRTVVKRKYILETPQENTEVADPPTLQIGDRLRKQMAKDLANIAKDMMHGQAQRIIPLLQGNARTPVAVAYEGINDEDGLPVAYLRAKVPNIKRSSDGKADYEPYALVKIFHDIDRMQATRSPGKVAFADIEFEVTRGHNLAQAFTKWVDDWVPIHNVSSQAGRNDKDDRRGDAVRGARKARAHKQFVRTGIEIDLRRFGFTSKNGEPILARLMISPIVKRPPNLDDDGLRPYRVFSLHRTMEEGTVPGEALRNIEEEVLIGATVAVEDSLTRYTMFGLVFGDQFRRRETKIMYALNDAIVRFSGEHDFPDRFNSPLNYTNLKKALTAEEQALWTAMNSNNQTQQNRQAQQQQSEEDQEQVNIEVANRLMADDDMNDWFPNVSQRRQMVILAIEEAHSNPGRIDVSDEDQLFERAKNYAETRRS